jgi:hypothetical protein
LLRTALPAFTVIATATCAFWKFDRAFANFPQHPSDVDRTIRRNTAGTQFGFGVSATEVLYGGVMSYDRNRARGAMLLVAVGIAQAVVIVALI